MPNTFSKGKTLCKGAPPPSSLLIQAGPRAEGGPGNGPLGPVGPMGSWVGPLNPGARLGLLDEPRPLEPLGPFGRF